VSTLCGPRPGAFILTRADTTLLLETDAYYAAVPPEPSAKTEGFGLLLGIMIWMPGIGTATIMYLVGQPLLAFGALAASMLLHIIFVPRVAVYALIATICIQHVVTFLPQIGTIAKFMGVVAGVVSLPRIVNAMGSRRNDPIVKWIVPFVLLGFLTFPLSPLPLFSLTSWVTMLLVYSMPLILCLQLVREEYFQVGLVVFVLTCLITAVMFIHVGDASVVEGWRRAELLSITGEVAANDMNEQARLMALGVLATIFLFFVWRGLAKKAICLATGFVLCIGIVISKSRACYIGVPAAVILGFLFSRWTSLPRKFVTITTSSVLLVLVFFIGGEVGFFGTGIQKRFDSIFEQGVSAGGRSTYWMAHLQVSMHRTGFMGNGLKGALVSEELGRISRRAVAHNNVVDVLSDLGVAGLFLFIAIHVHLFRRVWKLPFKNEQLFGFMVLFFMIIAGMVQKDYLRKYYCLSLGLMLVLIRLAERRAVKEEWEHGSDTGFDGEYALPHMYAHPSPDRGNGRNEFVG